MSILPSFLRTRFLRVAALTLTVLAVLPGCPSHAHLVRDAQDALSEAAEIDNRLKLEPRTGANDAASANALEKDANDAATMLRSYALAQGLSSRAISESRDDLASSGLLGTALTVRGLALWRLGKTDLALEDAREVVRLSGTDGQVWPRDLAVAKAMPTYVAIDSLGQAASKSDLALLRGRVRDAAVGTTVLGESVPGIGDRLESVRMELPARHPMRIQLLFSFVKWLEIQKKAITTYDAGTGLPKLKQAIGLVEAKQLIEEIYNAPRQKLDDAFADEIEANPEDKRLVAARKHFLGLAGSVSGPINVLE